MKDSVKHLFEQLEKLISQLTPQQYAQELEVLSSNSIGKHLRHILDLYECLMVSSEDKIVCYDGRKREELVEISPEFALQKMNEILNKLSELPLNQNLILRQELNGKILEISSNFERELLYNIEHTVHHMALIRIGVQTAFPKISIDDKFGIAFSTLKHRAKA